MLTLPILTLLFSEHGSTTHPAKTHTQRSNPETRELSVLLLPIRSPSPTASARCGPRWSWTFRGCCLSWLSPCPHWQMTLPQILALCLIMGSPAQARSSDLSSFPLGSFQGFGKGSLRSLALAPENPLLVPPLSPRFPSLALGCFLMAASGCALAGLAWPGPKAVPRLLLLQGPLAGGTFHL